MDDAGGGEVGDDDLVWADEDLWTCGGLLEVRIQTANVYAVSLVESMDVLCPPSSHDVRLQDKAAVACNEGTTNTGEAQLVSLPNGLNMTINKAVYVVLVKPNSPVSSCITCRLWQLLTT
jgi:hypothetical protein